MRSNIVSEAGISTRLSLWWEDIPFSTSLILILCGAVYLACLLVGYDSFYEVCFLPSAVASQFEVYRIYTSVIFHGSLLHVLLNMLAFTPLGSEIERIMGTIRLLYMTVLLATSNAILHLAIALLVVHNPIHSDKYFMNECSIGFSGILFSMTVIETSLSRAQTRSLFGFLNVPAKLYPWILLVVFQLLMANVSLLGHLCGVLSGFAYVYGLFNFLIPGASFLSAVESSSWLSTCVRRPKFILCAGGNHSGDIPTHASRDTTSSGLTFGSLLQSVFRWIPRRDSTQSDETDARFPGRGMTLGSGQSQSNGAVRSDPGLQTRLLENRDADLSSDVVPPENLVGLNGNTPKLVDEKIQKLVSMGFEKTQVEVALAAADGNLNTAVEILTSQQS